MSYFETPTGKHLPKWLTSCLLALCALSASSTHASPLHEACSEGKLEEVVRLLQDPATDPNLRDELGRSPLYTACTAGHLDVVECFLKKPHIDLNTLTKDGRTPLDIIHHSMRGAKSQAEWDRYDAIWHALLRKGGKLAKEKPWWPWSSPVKPSSPNEKGLALRQACRKGKLKEVIRLLKDPAADLNAPDIDGRTSLHIACSYGHLDVVKCLLQDQRIDPNTPDKYGWPPLYKACRLNLLAEAECLLKSDRVDPNAADENGWTPLHAAAFQAHLDIVKCLLQNPHVDPNMLNKKGETPLDRVYGMMSATGYQAHWEEYNAIWNELVSKGGKLVKEKSEGPQSIPHKPPSPADRGQVSEKK